jgi:hypothetical protein
VERPLIPINGVTARLRKLLLRGYERML